MFRRLISLSLAGITQRHGPVSSKFTEEVRKMRRRDVVLILMFLLIGTSMVDAQEIVNLFDNPGFEEGEGTDVQEIPGWQLYKQENATGLLTIDTEEAIEGKQCVFIEVTGVPAGGTWNLRFDHTRRFSVEQGMTYTMSFWLKGDAGPITLSASRAEQNPAGAWGALAQEVVNPTAEWEEYHLTFESPEDRLVMWQLLISNPEQTYYADHARCYEGEYVPDAIGQQTQAYSPAPDDGAIYEDTWVNLGWRTGDFAVSHDVYFGDNFDDVNVGAESVFQGNQAGTFLVAGFPGFPYPEGLVPGTTYYWRIDEVNDTEPNSPWKGTVWSFTIPPKTAYDPIPTDGVKFVSLDAELSWTRGFGSKLHTVYFGDNFDDVNNAVVGLPQLDATYTPGTLDLDKAYYWRVDEFDGADTYKGDVWSFRTLPIIPITNPNLVGWWKLDEGAVAFDWSGHGNYGTLEGDPQWVAGYDGDALEFDGNGDYVELPTGIIGSDKGSISMWIKTIQTVRGMIFYGSDGTSGDGYGSDNELHINVENGGVAEFLIEGGDSDVSIESSALNDDSWHHIAATWDINGQASLYVDGGAPISVDHTGNNFNLSGRIRLGRPNASTRYYAGLLDDVRVFNYVLSPDDIALTMRGDVKLAWNPKPANGAILNKREVSSLGWSPGDNASQHDVYLGTDRDAVADADASDTTGTYRGRQGAASYTPPEGIEWGQSHFWRIDEYNTDATITKGRIWSFTILDFILVEDFEDYDIGNNEIWWAWIDGLGYASHPTLPAHPGNGTGSIVGDETTGSYMEETIVHGGGKSMPVFYDNNQQGKVRYSEVEKTLSSQRDWTVEGVGVLSVWFYGVTSNAAEPLYVALNGNAVVTHDNPNATQIEAWTEWTIDLQAFADRGVNLANVNTIAIGLGNKKNPVAGGSGKIYIDDIRLYRPPEPAP